MKHLFIFLLLGALVAPTITWNKIDEGLYVAEYQSPQLSAFDNSTITILKVDPKYYDFKLLHSDQRHTVKQWATQDTLLAVVNAGMYTDSNKNLGLMKHYKWINPIMNKDRAVLAMNPVNDTLPGVQIIDLKAQNWSELNNKYHSFTQSIRMTDIYGKNLWLKRNKMWSMVVVAIDKEGNVLFIHTRSPYAVHDFINILMQSPLNIKNMMYLEGGPEASLYLNHNGAEISRVGSYETDFYEGNSNTEFWAIPNVIGITKKQ